MIHSMSPRKPKPVEIPKTTTVLTARLKPHPRNYRKHGEEQITHLMESLRANAFYRNAVIAKDSTILAGHGIIEAAVRLGMERVSVVRLPLDPMSPQALKILASDNTLSLFAEDDDRMLTDLLRDVKEGDSLLGTGYSDQALAALVMVTRPASEIADFDAAAEWTGMPEFEHAPTNIQIVIRCDTEQDRTDVLALLDVPEKHIRHGREIWSLRWPTRGQDDVASLVFE